MKAPYLSLKDIHDAESVVKQVAWRTPLLPFPPFESLFLKMECLQRTGSFKIRGAWNRMTRATREEIDRGFTATSAGNHGQAVAWCARRLNAKCTVYVPDDAVKRKVDSILSLGANVVKLSHAQIMDAMAYDTKWDMTYIHPFGDPYVIAGQGTVGLEILDALPEVKSIIVPVGGGGLVNGIAIAVKSKDVKVYGVQAEGAAPLPKSLMSGRAEDVGSPNTIADGIAATRVFDYMLPLFKKNLDDVFTVTDEEIKKSMSYLLHDCHVVSEPAGASSLAATIRYWDRLEKPAVAVISGGNCDPNLLLKIVNK
ncbi:MAG: threonine/serine dehydratase [Conexivisphaerales archaeon]